MLAVRRSATDVRYHPWGRALINHDGSQNYGELQVIADERERERDFAHVLYKCGLIQTGGHSPSERGQKNKKKTRNIVNRRDVDIRKVCFSFREIRRRGYV